MAAAASNKYRYADLLVSIDRGVATVTFNRPNRKNAINAQMYLDIRDVLNGLDKDESVVCAVLTGAGDYYSSGNDLAGLAAPLPEGKTPEVMSRETADGLVLFMDAFIDFSKPLIGAVNGPAFGVAVTTLAMCDIVYASATATFQTPFVSLGQSCEGLSSLLFPRLMGFSKANEILLTGMTIDAKQAESRNLVSAVLPFDGFHAAVHAKARAIAQLPVNTLRANKRLIRGHVIDQWKAVNRKECDLLSTQWISEDCMNAIMKFMLEQSAKRDSKKQSATPKSKL